MYFYINKLYVVNPVHCEHRTNYCMPIFVFSTRGVLLLKYNATYFVIISNLVKSLKKLHTNILNTN